MQKFTNSLVLLKKEWRFSVIFFLYLLAWVIPFGWMRDMWLPNYALLNSQPFILPFFFAILFGWREILKNYFEELDQWSRHTGKRTKNGSLTLLIIGCVLFFLAHFSRLSIAAILGLVLILIGTFIRIYNKQFIRIILVPILYLLMIVPWFPETVYTKIGDLGIQIHGMVTSKIFLLLGKSISISSDVILINGASIPTPFELFGFQGLVSTLVFFTGYGLFRRLSSQKILNMNLMGLFVAFIVHQARLITVCFLVSTNPVAATKFAALNCWIFTIPSITMTFLVVKLVSKISRPLWIDTIINKLSKISRYNQKIIDKLLFGSLKAGSGATGIILRIFYPLTWTFNIILNGIIKLGSLIGASNKSVENLIRRGERKIQNRKKR